MVRSSLSHIQEAPFNSQAQHEGEETPIVAPIQQLSFTPPIVYNQFQRQQQQQQQQQQQLQQSTKLFPNEQYGKPDQALASRTNNVGNLAVLNNYMQYQKLAPPLSATKTILPGDLTEGHSKKSDGVDSTKESK